jgi:hypothetical protein
MRNGDNVTTIQELRENYIRIRALKDGLADAVKENNAQLAKAERALIEGMMEAEITSQKTQSGATFAITPRLHMSITLGNTAEVLSWLESIGHSPEDLTRQELIPARVREIVRDVYHKKGKMHVPECLKLDDSPGITVTNWDAAKAAPSVQED